MVMEYVINDARGQKLAVGDRVRVTAFGFGARIPDVGVESEISAMFETRVGIIDSDGQKRRVGGPVLLKLEPEPDEATPTDVQCGTCGRLFKNERALRSHRRIHG